MKETLMHDLKCMCGHLKSSHWVVEGEWFECLVNNCRCGKFKEGDVK